MKPMKKEDKKCVIIIIQSYKDNSCYVIGKQKIVVERNSKSTKMVTAICHPKVHNDIRSRFAYQYTLLFLWIISIRLICAVTIAILTDTIEQVTETEIIAKVCVSMVDMWCVHGLW